MKVDVLVTVLVDVNVEVRIGVLVEVFVDVRVGVNGNGVLVDPPATTVPPPKSFNTALPALTNHKPIYPPFAE